MFGRSVCLATDCRHIERARGRRDGWRRVDQAATANWILRLDEHGPVGQTQAFGLDGPRGQMGNKLLSVSADCRQLTDWCAHKHSLLDDYGQYQASIALMDKQSRRAPPSVRKATKWWRSKLPISNRG